MPPKGKAGGAKKGPKSYKLPDPISPGEILTDVQKRKWRLGRSVGVGGFGEIYAASDNIDEAVKADAPYVIKIEPHANGPLFVEMSFYMRVAKPEKIREWMTAHKLGFLGMPAYIGSGSHEYKGEKYRFLVMQRFGSDVQKLFEAGGRCLPLEIVYNIGLKVIDALEYIHDKEYVHADIKGSNLLLGFGKGKENEVWLVDFGLACRYATEAGHKPNKPDPKKAHNGTIEFTSRDAHIGALSRRGDMEILAYNLVQWLCGRLPWEDKLSDCEYVAAQKNRYVADVPLFLKTCFGSKSPPGAIKKFVELVSRLKFEEQPNYSAFRELLKQGLKEAGLTLNAKLVLSAKETAVAGTSASPKRKRTADASGSVTSESKNAVPKKQARGRPKKQAKAVSSPSSSSVSDRSTENIPVPAKRVAAGRRVNYGYSNVSVSPSLRRTSPETSSLVSGDITPLRVGGKQKGVDSRFFTPEASPALASSTPVAEPNSIDLESSSDSSKKKTLVRRKRGKRISESVIDETDESSSSRHVMTRKKRGTKKAAVTSTATQTTPGVMKVSRVPRKKQHKTPPVIDISSDMFDE